MARVTLGEAGVLLGWRPCECLLCVLCVRWDFLGGLWDVPGRFIATAATSWSGRNALWLRPRPGAWPSCPVSVSISLGTLTFVRNGNKVLATNWERAFALVYPDTFVIFGNSFGFAGVPRQRNGCVDYDEFVIYKQAKLEPSLKSDWSNKCFWLSVTVLVINADTFSLVVAIIMPVFGLAMTGTDDNEDNAQTAASKQPTTTDNEDDK